MIMTAILMVWTSIGFALSLLYVNTTYPHGGGLDANGCHHDRKRGGYHCHRAPQTDAAAPTKTKSGLIQEKPEAPQAPVTHIGPRGGRYHYSASGRKVYDRRK
jgi:hypothetical protein